MASKTRVNINYEKFAKQGDLLLASGVVTILFVMLIPMPTIVMDVMLTISISLAMVVLVTTMFMTSPMEFSIFPSLLLVTTLLRLSLNVASTRLILLHGDEGTSAAGRVIQTFGEFVVGGNFVIGVVIFLVLFALNKMVIVSGTSRIAEVAARFTLDSLPGKQMAIEADLNAGLINEEEAKAEREAIRKEADFYGAMDGAGKFVSGDVKAGMLITAINIIGGIFIGMVQKDMSWMDAAQTYTLLTIGDGLVSTIPSIIISTSTGIIVSRAASEARMGEEFLGQLTYHSRALKLVSAILIIFALIPGMPMLVFLALSGLLFFLSRLSSAHHGDEAAEKEAEARRNAPALDTPEEVQALLPLDTLELEVGYGLIPLVDEEQDGNLLARIRSIRRQFALDMGVIVPSLHPKHRIQGVETVEPAFNLPALWIPETQREEAMLAGYTVVDPATVIATHLTEVFKRNMYEFLGRQEVQTLLDNLSKHAPKAVEELVPGALELGTVQKVLQNLVREGVSIRDLLTVVETMADFGKAIKDPDQLTEYVRSRLSRTIIKPYMDSQGGLPIVVLSANVDKAFSDNIRQTDQGAYLAMDPNMAQTIIQSINDAAERAVGTDGQPVLLATPTVRPHLSQLLARFIPNLPVISQAEIPADVKLETLAQVDVPYAG